MPSPMALDAVPGVDESRYTSNGDSTAREELPGQIEDGEHKKNANGEDAHTGPTDLLSPTEVPPSAGGSTTAGSKGNNAFRADNKQIKVRTSANFFFPFNPLFVLTCFPIYPSCTTCRLSTMSLRHFFHHFERALTPYCSPTRCTSVGFPSTRAKWI